MSGFCNFFMIYLIANNNPNLVPIEHYSFFSWLGCFVFWTYSIIFFLHSLIPLAQIILLFTLFSPYQKLEILSVLSFCFQWRILVSTQCQMFIKETIMHCFIFFKVYDKKVKCLQSWRRGHVIGLHFSVH